MSASLFSQNEARAAITVAQVTQAAVTTAAATQNTAAFTPVADTLYLMWTIQTIGTGPPTVPTATCANGLAMVQVNTVTFATITTQLKRLTLFRAMKPSGLVNGTCTITWGQTTTGHGHVIVGYNGVDTSGTDGSGAIAQSVTGRTNSATAAAGLSITLAALQAGSTTSGGFSNAVNNANSLTAGAGYTAGTGAAFNTPATSIRAEWNTAGSTTVNMTQSATSHIGGIAVEVKAKPTTTLATGTDPLATTIAPGDPATDVDIFTLQTSSGTEAITSVTVNLSTNSGVGRLAITDNLGAELGFTATPVAGANTITVAGMSATTALTTFKVRVTPLSHAAMPLPNGAAYTITAPVTAWVGPNTHAGSDTNPNALTIDNLSPSGATATSGSAGTDSVTLGWTTSASADFNTTGGSVLYRWATTAGAEVPVEGSAPAVNSSNGAATVACVLSSTASFAFSGIIDGTGGSAGCNTTALAPGTDYIYKIFQKDTRGNYDTGVTIGTFTTTYPVPTTTSISPTSQTLGALGFTLTVNGTNFTPGSIVQFAGSARTTTYVSPTQLTATIPATDLTTVGTFSITVFNPAPGGGTSNAQTFTVTPAPPSAVTNAATGVTSAVATLNGTVGSNGASTTVSFEYGPTAAYGSSIAATQSPLAAGSPPYPTAAVSALVEGVNCNTTFHYRVVATNSAGTTNGLDGTFTTGACSAPFPATACAATRYGTDLGCTAGDVNITGITLAPGSISSCVSGAPVSLNLDLTVNFAVPDRWDVGIFISNDGKLPTLLPANGGANSCSVAVLPIVPETGSYTFPDLDGVPQGTADTCGDGNGAIDDSAFPSGTVPLGDGVKRMTGVTLPCYASLASGGKLFVPFAVSWDNQKSPVGSLCTSNQYPVPNTTSKCNAPASSVGINVVVLPVITKTNGGTEINPGANTTYTVTIFNNSGGTLLDMVFTDPVVTNLTVNSVSCAAASGATCPAMTSAAMIAAMQPPPSGAGIPIPSASLPNNSSLTFTINATVSPGAGIGSHIINTATATLTGGGSTSASDDDLVVLAPSAAMSFSPATITEGATSLLTITLTNPTASPVTGVSFTDTYPSGVVNAGSAVTTCPGGTATTPTSGSLVLSGGTIPANGSCTVTVNVTSATACSAPCYVNSTGLVTTNSGTISAASATLTVNVAVFGAFNACDDAVDPNVSCTNTTTSTTSHITTKIAGVPFTLDLVALNSDGSWNSSYSNDVIVELLDASDNSGTPVTPGCLSSWTPITTLGSYPSFASSNGQITTTNGQPITSLNSFTVPEAYRDVRVRVSNNGGATRVGCSTDFFAIRPYAFTLTTSASADTSSGSNATATPTFVAASSTFTVTATPVNALGNAITNYTGTPKVDVAQLAGTTTLGTLATPIPTSPPTFQTTATGTFTYTEVGYLKFDERSIYDDTWTSLDASDCTSDFSNTLVGVKYGCKFGNTSPGGTTNVIWAGRFKPDHFDITGTVVTRSDLQATEGQATPFTYMDEPMKLTLTVTAYNSVDGITKNYAGDFFAKLNATGLGIGNNWFNTGCTTTTQCMGLGAVNDNFAQCTANPSQTGCAAVIATCTATPNDVVCTKGLSNRLSIDTTSTGSGTPSNTAWNNGTSDFTAYVKFGRQISPLDGPYQKLKLGGMPRDSEGVTLPGPGSSDVHHVDLDATAGDTLASNPDTTNERKLLSPGFTTDVRFGRLHLLNAYGSELLPMRVDARTEYWDGTRWALNTVDALTAIPSGGMTASNGIAANTCFLTNPPPSAPTNAACLPGSPSASPITPFSGGLGRWIVFDMTPPSVGYVDLSIDLTAMPWLRGFWTSAGAGYGENPNARIKFGSPQAPYIYLRERY